MRNLEEMEQAGRAATDPGEKGAACDLSTTEFSELRKEFWTNADNVETALTKALYKAYYIGIAAGRSKEPGPQ